MKQILIFSAFIMLMALPFSCSEDTPEVNDEFDREGILDNVATNIIVPAYQDFSEKTEFLQQKTETFLAQPTAQTLEEVRNAWIAAKLSWKSGEAFNFGPVEQLALETAIDLWPTNASGIEEAIQNYNGAATYMEAIGSDRKGLAAVEYLLFHADQTQIVGEFAAENRKAYLNLLVQTLADHASKLLGEWENGYESTFISNTGNNANASTTLLSNEMIFLLETVKNYKVATPLGLRTLSDPLPEQVESLYADLSLDLIRENLKIMESIFTGKAGQGFDDYLDALDIDDGQGNALSAKILQKFTKSHQSLDAIDGPLQVAVLEQKEAVEQLFIDLQELTVLLKNDMMSRLGLLVIFSDNDGD